MTSKMTTKTSITNITNKFRSTMTNTKSKLIKRWAKANNLKVISLKLSKVNKGDF